MRIQIRLCINIANVVLLLQSSVWNASSEDNRGSTRRAFRLFSINILEWPGLPNESYRFLVFFFSFNFERKI